LLVKFSDLRASDGPGKWTYDYVSLLDPASTDRNFATVSDTPYLYYVRSDGNHPPYARALPPQGHTANQRLKQSPSWRK
jgi:hypothetical protein